MMEQNECVTTLNVYQLVAQKSKEECLGLKTILSLGRPNLSHLLSPTQMLRGAGQSQQQLFCWGQGTRSKLIRQHRWECAAVATMETKNFLLYGVHRQVGRGVA
jgi:hypothetical protein